MVKKIYFGLLATTLFIATYSCKSDRETGIREYFISHRNAERPVSDIIESYELIQLEEREEAYFQIARRVFFAEGKIILLTSDHRILTFSETGEFINSVDKRGRGPDEYESLNDLCYDANTGKIIGSCFNEILWFNVDGDILKRMDPKIRFNNVHLTGKAKLLFDIHNPGYDEEFNYNLVLTDMDLNVIDQRIELPILEGPGLAVYGQQFRTSGIPGEDYFFSFLCDTIYRVRNDRIVPDIVFNYEREVFSITNGVEDPDFGNKYCFVQYLETSSYIVLVFRDDNLNSYTAVADKDKDIIDVYKGGVGDLNITNTIGNSVIVKPGPSIFTRMIDMYDPNKNKCTNPELLRHYLDNTAEISSLLIKVNLRYQ